MNRTKIVNLIRDRLGFNKSLSEEIILRHMDYVQAFYELGQDNQPLPWFLFKPNAFVETEVGKGLVPLPEGFVSFDDDWPIMIRATTKVTDPLEMMTLAEYNELVADGEIFGYPTRAVLAGNFLQLYPSPDAIYKITIPHYGRIGYLSENETSDWYKEFPNLIVEETAVSLLRSLRDIDGLRTSNVSEFKGDYLRRIEARKHTLKDYYMNGGGAE